MLYESCVSASKAGQGCDPSYWTGKKTIGSEYKSKHMVVSSSQIQSSHSAGFGYPDKWALTPLGSSAKQVGRTLLRLCCRDLVDNHSSFYFHATSDLYSTADRHIMDFQQPEFTADEDRDWANIAKPGFRDPKILHDFWQKFNTCNIPLLPRDNFVVDALDCARLAEDRTHLEELLQKKFEYRCKTLGDGITGFLCAALDTDAYQAAPKDVRLAAQNISISGGSLKTFIEFVYGVISSPDQGGFGREMETPPELPRTPSEIPRTPSDNRDSVDISDLPTPDDGAQRIDRFDVRYDDDLEQQIEENWRSTRITELRDDAQITAAPLPDDRQAFNPQEHKVSGQNRTKESQYQAAAGSGPQDKSTQSPITPADTRSTGEGVSDRPLTPKVYLHQPSSTTFTGLDAEKPPVASTKTLEAYSPNNSPEVTATAIIASCALESSATPCSGRKRRIDKDFSTRLEGHDVTSLKQPKFEEVGQAKRRKYCDDVD